MKKIIVSAVTIALFGLSGAVQAQARSPFSVSLGATSLKPSVTSGQLSAPALPDSRIDVGSASGLTGAVNYQLSEQVSLSVPFGLGFKHNIVGAGNPLIAGLGKLGTIKVLPVTMFGQYRFLGAASAVRPFVGFGITYAKFYDENSTPALTLATNPGGPATTTKTDSKLAPTFQLGLDYNLNSAWYVQGSYAKTLLKTTTHLSTNQSVSVKLNPSALQLQLGYRF